MAPEEWHLGAAGAGELGRRPHLGAMLSTTRSRRGRRRRSERCSIPASCSTASSTAADADAPRPRPRSGNMATLGLCQHLRDTSRRPRQYGAIHSDHRRSATSGGRSSSARPMCRQSAGLSLLPNADREPREPTRRHQVDLAPKADNRQLVYEPPPNGVVEDGDSARRLQVAIEKPGSEQSIIRTTPRNERRPDWSRAVRRSPVEQWEHTSGRSIAVSREQEVEALSEDASPDLTRHRAVADYGFQRTRRSWAMPSPGVAPARHCSAIAWIQNSARSLAQCHAAGEFPPARPCSSSLASSTASHSRDASSRAAGRSGNVRVSPVDRSASPSNRAISPRSRARSRRLSRSSRT